MSLSHRHRTLALMVAAILIAGGSLNILILNSEPDHTGGSAKLGGTVGGHRGRGATIHVDAENASDETGNGSADNPYETIQKAIEVAYANDTIIVQSGRYYELVYIDKPLNLIGNTTGGRGEAVLPIIDGRQDGNPVTLASDGIWFQGFNVTNSSNTYTEDGVRVLSENNTIIDCVLQNNLRSGIWFESVGVNRVENCLSYGNGWYGIHAKGSNGIVVENCVVRNNDRDGIYFESTHNSTVLNNHAYGNHGDGIVIIDSPDITIIGNNASTNWYNGIESWNSHRTRIFNNTANDNRDEDGVGITYSDNNTVVNNTCLSNRRGFHIRDSSDNVIRGNTAHENDRGIHLTASSERNHIEDNVVSDNDGGIGLEYTSNDNEIHKNNANGSGWCISLDSSHDNNITNNQANSGWEGIYVVNSENNTISLNSAGSNGHSGIYMVTSENNIVSGNTMISNDIGILSMSDTRDNLIYNNYLDNPKNALDYGSNIWNTDKTPGTNILGGPWLGGNWWSDYGGDDLDDDGLGDTPHHIPEMDNEDGLPLVTVIPGADLIITDIWLREDIISFQVRNVGKDTIPSSHLAALYVDGDLTEVVEVTDVLGTGERWDGSFAWERNCAGTDQVIRVSADKEDAVRESFEDNNAREERWRCDVTPPVFQSGPMAHSITTGSVDIVWETDEDTMGRVSYGQIAGVFPLELEYEILDTDHSLRIEGLQPSTIYHFAVTATDASGNSMSSKELFFETPPRLDLLDPIVSAEFSRNATGLVTFSADAEDDTGIGMVEFFLDGVLVNIDYSAPYEFTVDTRLVENGDHDLTVKAYDFGGRWVEMDTTIHVVNKVDTGAPSVTITSPVGGESLSGKTKVKVTLSDDTGLMMSRMLVDGNWTGSWFPASDPTTQADIKFVLDTTSLDNGNHRIAVEVYDSNNKYSLGIVDIKVSNGPPATPANLVLQRDVSQTKNSISVDIVVKNTGSSDARNVSIRDQLELFHPVSYANSFADYNGSYDHVLATWEMDITCHVPIPAGSTRIFSYSAVPVLTYPQSSKPMIGGNSYAGFIDLWYESAGDINTYHESVSLKSVLATEYQDALRAADYLIITNPVNLNMFNDQKSVDELLDAMAELAWKKEGALGFVNTAPSFPMDLSVHDGIAVGNVLDDAEEEIVIVDHDKDMISIHRADGTFRYSINLGKKGYGFDSGDSLALGHVRKGTHDQIVIADVDRGIIEIQDVNGVVFNSFFVELGSFDGFAVGEIDGDPAFEEIVLGDADKNRIIIFSNTGKQLGNFNFDLQEHDGLAIGDVTGDVENEIIVADQSANKVWVLDTTGTKLGWFASEFDAGDSLAVGNVEITWPLDKMEICIADHSKDKMMIYRGDGYLLDSFQTKMDNYDGIAIGNVVREAKNPWDAEEIVQMERNRGGVKIHVGGSGTVDRNILLDLIKHKGKWNSKLTKDFSTEGYLLIVGETEIIPAFSRQFGTVKTTRGDTLLLADLTDLPYANTMGSEKRPELSVGRIIGNSADDLKKIIDTSLNVEKEVSGYGFDRSFSLGVSGYPACIHGGCDSIDFRNEMYTAALTMKNKGIDGIVMSFDDYTVYNGKTVDWIATVNKLTDLFFNYTPEKDIIFLSGHGSPNAWDEISATAIMAEKDPFGSTNPIVYAASCSTGRYGEGYSMPEAFLTKGAGVYIGATEFGLGSQIYISAKLFQNWDAGESIGYALKQTKQNVAGGTKSDKYYNGVYHLFGDPKFGTEGPPTRGDDVGNGRGQDDGVQAGGPSIDITIPNYELNSSEGIDFITIPGGDLLVEQGYPIIPYYRVQYEYPQGTQVHEVMLESRSVREEIFDLNLSVADIGIGSDVGYYVRGDLESDVDLPELWPYNEFDWKVFETPDSIILELLIYPFQYHPLRGYAEYFRNYSFKVVSSVSNTSIAQMDCDQYTYTVGDEIRVDMSIWNADSWGRDIIVQGWIEMDGSENVTGGFPLRVLKGLQGNATHSMSWNSSGSEPGTYRVHVGLLDKNGTQLDRRMDTFELGYVSGVITSLNATPVYFDPGEEVGISMTFNNTGTQELSGTAVIGIMNTEEGGSLVLKIRKDINGLSPGGSLLIEETWETSDLPDGTYEIVGYVSFDNTISNVESFKITTSSPPTPDFNYSPVFPEVNSTVRFDASSTLDPGGLVESYYWDFGDGEYGDGIFLDHIYVSLGNFNVTLTVLDSLGHAYIHEKLVSVNPVGEGSRIINVTLVYGNEKIEPGDTLLISGTIFVDPSGEIENVRVFLDSIEVGVAEVVGSSFFLNITLSKDLPRGGHTIMVRVDLTSGERQERNFDLYIKKDITDEGQPNPLLFLLMVIIIAVIVVWFLSGKRKGVGPPEKEKTGKIDDNLEDCKNGSSDDSGTKNE